jgi:hypothetical protein
MRYAAIRLLMLGTCAMTVMAIVATTSAEASSRHIRKHHQQSHLRVNNAWASEEVRPIAPARSWGGGEVCPGNARAIDCRIWPPPIYDDPDRRQSGSDGGG